MTDDSDKTFNLANPCKQANSAYNWFPKRDATCCGGTTPQQKLAQGVDILDGCNTKESVKYSQLIDRIIAYIEQTPGKVVELTGYHQASPTEKSYACNMIIPTSDTKRVNDCWNCCAKYHPLDSKAYASCKIICACPPLIVQSAVPDSIDAVRNYIARQINKINYRGTLPDLVVLQNWNCFPPLTHTITVLPDKTIGGGGGVMTYYWIIIVGVVILAAFFFLYKYT